MRAEARCGLVGINKRRLGRRKELVFVDEVGGLTGMFAAINVGMGLDVYLGDL